MPRYYAFTSVPRGFRRPAAQPDARMHAAPPPRLAGIRAGGLTRFAFPSRFANLRIRGDSGIKKRMRGTAESKLNRTARRRSLTVAGTAQVERATRCLFPV
ncbi:hypothetical protein QFZ96_007789 [Paraburkholderia youngii]